jgi:hypothetical protein
MKPFVRVKWHDAEDFKEANWSTEEDLQEFSSAACEATSFGYLVKKNRGYVTLAADFIPPDVYGRVMKIPRKMIIMTQEITLLEDQQTEPIQKKNSAQTVLDTPKPFEVE